MKNEELHSMINLFLNELQQFTENMREFTKQGYMYLYAMSRICYLGKQILCLSPMLARRCVCITKTGLCSSCYDQGQRQEFGYLF